MALPLRDSADRKHGSPGEALDSLMEPEQRPCARMSPLSFVFYVFVYVAANSISPALALWLHVAVWAYYIVFMDPPRDIPDAIGAICICGPLSWWLTGVCGSLIVETLKVTVGLLFIASM